MRRISHLRLRSLSLLRYTGHDDGTKDSREALSPDEIKERIRMICAEEPNIKAAFHSIFVVVSEKEILERLNVVGLRMKESDGDSSPIVASTDSCAVTTQDDGLLEVEKENLQPKGAKVVGPGVVAHDPTAAPKATVLEFNEDTVSDQMVRDLDQLVKDISSDLLLKDVEGLINPTSSGSVKVVEKKRKARATDFTLARFKIKTKKTTKSSSVPVASNQSTPQEKIPKEEVVEPTLEQVTVPAPA